MYARGVISRLFCERNSFQYILNSLFERTVLNVRFIFTCIQNIPIDKHFVIFSIILDTRA